MATEEHKYLANIIKETHASLREEAQNYGPDIAWRRHVNSKDLLQNYAVSMQKLATMYWAEHNLDSKYGTHCRVEWIKSQCREYFFNGGIEKYDRREEDINIKINTSYKHANINENSKNTKSTDIQKELDVTIDGKNCTKQINLLDVGSCYNPFGTEDTFNVTAIDLNGIPDKVLQCDFLNVVIGHERILSDNTQEVLQLPENSFDVVVFSLLLEYLPCPEQRYLCCKKAYRLLQNRGILVIISPDSKHVGANARIMKAWRYALSKLGFMRIKYEKLRHIHCMVYRKCTIKHVALRWADLQTFPRNDPLYEADNKIYIPQDFHVTLNECEEGKVDKYTADDLMSVFNELPFDDT